MSTDLTRLMHALLAPASQAWEQVHWSPPVDVYRASDGWLIKYDLAGVRPEDIQVEVHGCKVTVRGRRRDWVVEETHACSAYSMEITYSQFERTIELPCDQGTAHVVTSYRDGMLLVRLQTEGRAG